MPKTYSQIERYPLDWPVGVPRTAASERKNNTSLGKNMSWDRLIRDMRQELVRISAPTYILSTNQPIRKDGMPFAAERHIDDPGVALYFEMSDGDHVCFPCDRWATLPQNLRAIVMHMEAMRGMDRWGVGTSKQAYMGYKALAAVAGQDEEWWLVLGVNRKASAEQINAAHRALAMSAHPDRGGDSSQMARINVARDRGLAEIGGGK